MIKRGDPPQAHAKECADQCLAGLGDGPGVVDGWELTRGILSQDIRKILLPAREALLSITR